MRIILASPYEAKEANIAEALNGDSIVTTDAKPDVWPDADWVVCYGYRHILKPETIARYGNRIVNIHIACLPWNRGADPNFWSWVDNTPKGVTIHLIDAGINTGPIYSKLIVHLSDRHTLASSYSELRRVAALHFAAVWPGIREGSLIAVPQFTGIGSFCRAADKESIFSKLPLGWDTPVRDLMRIKNSNLLNSVSSSSGLALA